MTGTVATEERDIRASLTEEAELTACENVCVVIKTTNVVNSEVIAVHGPFTQAITAIGFGEERCNELNQESTDHDLNQVGYELRALWPPE